MKIGGVKGVLLYFVLLILFAGVFVFALLQVDNRKENYKETTAVISYINKYEEYEDIDAPEKTTFYQVFVDYEVDGVEYKHILYQDDARLYPQKGKEVTILYNVDNPSEIVAKNENAIMPIVAAIPLLLTIGFGVYGVIATVSNKGNKAPKKRAKK
jgi:hypothetical protein